MIMKLIGFLHKAGTFTDKETGEPVDFDNISLEIISDAASDTEYVKSSGGMHCNILKIKASDFNRLLPPEIIKPEDLQAWFGKEIRLDYSLVASSPVLTGISLKK